MARKILVIDPVLELMMEAVHRVTNVKEYEKVGYRTGLWLGELTHFLNSTL